MDMGEKMVSSVLIMMATFNGAKYIQKQIDSIIAQDYKNWNLIIQDDNSSDETYKIINKYIKKDSRISCWLNDCGRRGPYYNFHNLANKCKKINKYNYYMFCDQDDIWDQNKISRFLSVIEKQDQLKPLVCYADMRLIDENDKIIGISANKILGLAYKNKYSLFFSHIVFGCNMIMNAENFFQVPQIDLDDPYTASLSHDNLYMKYAALTGDIDYIDIQTMSYRRHCCNVTSKQEYNVNFYHVISRIIHLNALAADHALTYNQSLVTINMMKKTINNDELKQIEKVIRKGGLYAICYIYKRKIHWGKRIKNISRKITMFFGLYKKFLIE